MPFATVRHAPALALVVVALMAGCHSSLRHVPVDAAAPGPGAEPPVPVIDSGFEAVATVADATPNVSLDGTGNPNNGSTTSDGGAAAPVAPRDLGKAVPPEPMAPAGTTDGCAYSRVTAKGLQFQLQSTHYAALATLDYDYRSATSICYKSGGDASSRLTPLSVTNTARVLTDKIGQPIDEFYLAGTCNQEGLCTVTGCEAYVFSGPNLIVGHRFCWSDALEGPAKTVVIVEEVYAVEDGALYDFDGAAVPLDALLEGYKPTSEPDAAATCTE
jgi:hypothetical protein